jgi:hypothetical protein
MEYYRFTITKNIIIINNAFDYIQDKIILQINIRV